MVSAFHRVQEAKCSGTASNSKPNSEQTRFEFTQVMKASEMSYLVDTPDYYLPPSSYPQFKDQVPIEDDVIVVPEKFRHIFYGYASTGFAGMALPANRPVDLSGLLTVDWGATTTLTDGRTTRPAAAASLGRPQGRTGTPPDGLPGGSLLGGSLAWTPTTRPTPTQSPTCLCPILLITPFAHHQPQPQPSYGLVVWGAHPQPCQASPISSAAID